MLGLDEVESFVVGAAPTPPEVLEFFLALGIEIRETWGMSETTAIATLNPPGGVRVGTVGPPIPDTEVKLAEDGEVLVRGPQIMKGYRNMPEKTAEALSEDGWLSTGDVGEFDERGLPAHRRPQEGADHQRGGQEHVAGQHRGEAEGGDAVDRPGGRDRRQPPVQRRPLRPRPRDRSSPAGSPPRIPPSPSRSQVPSRPPTPASPGSSRSSASRSSPASGCPGGDELTPTLKLKRRPIERKYEAEIEALYA